jgi:hypothetical protein
MPLLITQAQLEDHLSQETVNRVFGDHGSEGASPEAVRAVLQYASDVLRGALGDIADLSEVDEASRPEVRRIGLDIAHAQAAIRHPEAMRIDGMKLMSMAKKDLEKIRLNRASLGSKDNPRTVEFAAGVAGGESRW